MPEAATDIDGDLLARKQDVDRSSPSTYRRLVQPIAEPTLVQRSTQEQFRTCIPVALRTEARARLGRGRQRCTRHSSSLTSAMGKRYPRGSAKLVPVRAKVAGVTQPPEDDLAGSEEADASQPDEVIDVAAPDDAWDLAGRDTVPDLTAMGGPSDVGSALLFALLNSEGAEWQPPYDRVRETLGVRKKTVLPELEEQTDQRLRTWMVLFRGLGLVYEDDGHLHVTDLGRQFREVMQSTYAATDDFAKEVSRASRIRIARVVGPALARYQLRNPLTKDRYDVATDIHPVWAIWQAVRSLDNRIHWDELDRTLTKCLRTADLNAAIGAIRKARQTPSYDPNDASQLEALLGPRRPVVGGADARLSRNQHDRVIVWLQRAAFRDIFLERTDRADGYRYANEEFVLLLDELAAAPPEHFDPDRDAAEYFRWLGQASPLAAQVPDSPFEGSPLLHMVVNRCRQFGASRIIALVGAAGTGKTALAREAAAVLADSDSTRIEVVQFHAAFTYEEFVGGLAPAAGGGFAPTPGVLIDFSDRARRAPDKTHVLVVDEVSRADVANVLGELLTYVEYRDRAFRVPALNRTVTLAPNLMIIATMNPADRSVINMDDALVRRLRQINVPRSTAALRTILSGAGMPDDLREQVCNWFDALPDDAPFGHGLFVDVATEQDLHQVWQEQLTFFIRRGGISVYPDPAAIEDGYVWRRPEYANAEEGTVIESVQPSVGIPLAPTQPATNDAPNEPGSGP